MKGGFGACVQRTRGQDKVGEREGMALLGCRACLENRNLRVHYGELEQLTAKTPPGNVRRPYELPQGTDIPSAAC